MNEDVKEELRRIIESDPDGEDFESWVVKSIKTLALCILDLGNDVCVVRKQLKLVLWFLGSIIVLIVVNLLR